MRKLRQDEIESRWSRYRDHGRHPIVVLLEDVRSAYNVGAMFRTGDAVGLEKIYICGITATPEHRGVQKTALGAQDSVDWEYAASAAAVVEQLRKEGFTIGALEITNEPTTIGELAETDFPLCLVVGNEVRGVSDETLGRCDLALELPQFGEKHSLNAAVAFGIAVYGVVGRYRRLGPSGGEDLREDAAVVEGSPEKTYAT